MIFFSPKIVYTRIYSEIWNNKKIIGIFFSLVFRLTVSHKLLNCVQFVSIFMSVVQFKMRQLMGGLTAILNQLNALLDKSVIIYIFVYVDKFT